MHYLVTLAPENKRDIAAGEEWAGNGEPVIPWFPAPVRNLFLSITSWKFTPYAVVIEDTFDVDALIERLVEKYPGLPRSLHENYVLETALAAAKLSIGSRVRAIIDDDSAQIQVLDTPTVIALWTKQPVEKKP